MLEFLATHDRITRREAAELTGLGPYQATRLVDCLVEDGQLVRCGVLRGAYYERRA